MASERRPKESSKEPEIVWNAFIAGFIGYAREMIGIDDMLDYLNELKQEKKITWSSTFNEVLEVLDRSGYLESKKILSQLRKRKVFGPRATFEEMTSKAEALISAVGGSDILQPMREIVEMAQLPEEGK